MVGLFFFPFLPSRGRRGVAKYTSTEARCGGLICFLLGDKDFQAGLRCPFELILKKR